MQRNATAARDADAYRPELIADEEPRYLRRQKPVEIRRKKFSGRGWPFYRHLLVLSLSGIVGATAAAYGMQFLLYSPSMLLVKPDQIEVTGNHIVSREAVLQQFLSDRNRSVLRIPLEARRGQLEQIPWVESASVQRILPNRLRIELTGKYKMLIDNFSQWQANAGHVQSIDLQYSRQVVVNPDTSSGTTTARTK